MVCSDSPGFPSVWFLLRASWCLIPGGVTLISGLSSLVVVGLLPKSADELGLARCNLYKLVIRRPERTFCSQGFMTSQWLKFLPNQNESLNAIDSFVN